MFSPLIPGNAVQQSGHSKNKVNPRLLLYLLVLCIAVFFRSYQLSVIPPGLWYDEARNLWHTQNIITYRAFDPSYFCGETLYAVFAVLGCLLKGQTPQGLRLGSAIAGILCIPAAWWAIRLIWGRKTALLSVFFLSILPWHVVFSRIGFRAVTMPLFLFLSLGAFETAFRKKKPAALLLLALFLGLGYHSYIPFKTVFLIFPIYAFSLWKERRLSAGSRSSPFPVKWKHIIPAAILLALLIVPSLLVVKTPGNVINIRIYQEHNLSREYVFTSQGPFANVLKLAGMFIWKGDPIARHNPPGAAQIPRFLFPFLLVGLMLSLKKPVRSGNILLLCSFVILLLPSVFSLSAPHAIRTIGALFPVCVFLSRGLRFVMIEIRRRFRNFAKGIYLKTAFTVFLAFTVLFCAWQYFILYGGNPDVWIGFESQYSELAEAIKTLPEGSVILRDPFEYGKLSFDVILRFSKYRIRTVNTKQDLIDKAPKDAPFYMVFAGKDVLGKEFLETYPSARIIKKIDAPDGRTFSLIYQVK
jgi:4-amino-4-deoxy-L-arabinose transferase-like glycosyltransferase